MEKPSDDFPKMLNPKGYYKPHEDVDLQQQYEEEERAVEEELGNILLSGNSTNHGIDDEQGTQA